MCGGGGEVIKGGERNNFAYSVCVCVCVCV